MRRTRGAGFWLGLWRGCTAPVTLVLSPFADPVSAEDFRRHGPWYDAGYVLGVSLVVEAVLRSRRTVTSRRPDQP